MTWGRLLGALLLTMACGWSATVEAATITSAALGNIFLQGQPLAFTLHANGNSAHWRARDFFGNEVASSDVTLAAGAAVFQPEIRGLGYFKLDISLDGKPAPEIQTAMAVLPVPDPPSPNSSFGVVTHFAKDWPTDIIPLIGKAGIARIRDEQPWRKVEKIRGQYSFEPRLTSFMGELRTNKIDPLIVLAFSNPLYDNDKTPFDDQGRAGYAAYAAAVAQHYSRQVGAVEVWNEYSGSFCDGPCRSDRPAYYAAMLKQSYKALKAADPSLVVAGGAAVPIPLDYFDGLFKQGALDAMDAVVIHPYRKTPEGVEEKIEALHQMMQRYGKVKPIWATEFGDPADMRKSRDDMARYLVRMSTLLMSAGTERVYWYLLKDFQEFSGMGLLLSESDPAGRYVPTPAYAAYAVLIKQLDGAHFVRREPSTPDLRVYVFSKAGREIRVAWSTTGSKPYEIHAEGTIRQLDMMGNEKAISQKGGAASVMLSTDPIYFTSGGAG
jgi:hypothetical protein